MSLRVRAPQRSMRAILPPHPVTERAGPLDAVRRRFEILDGPLGDVVQQALHDRDRVACGSVPFAVMTHD